VGATPATTTTAGRRVAHIYELLEHILVHAGPREILLLRRTSRCFRDVIGTSPRVAARMEMRLSRGREAARFPVRLPGFFEAVETRWTFNPGFPYKRQEYVMVRMDVAGLWKRREQRGRGDVVESWRGLFLTTPALGAVTVHVTGTADLTAWLGSGRGSIYGTGFEGSAGRRLQLPTVDPERHPHGYRMKLRRTMRARDGDGRGRAVVLGDLADMAMELYALDSNVSVHFSTYLDEGGGAYVQEWERFGMVDWDEALGRLKRMGELKSLV
jgi:hypothetical protein